MDDLENFSDLDNLLSLIDDEDFQFDPLEASKITETTEKVSTLNEKDSGCEILSVKFGGNLFTESIRSIGSFFSNKLIKSSSKGQTSIASFFKPPKRLSEEPVEELETSKVAKVEERPFTFPVPASKNNFLETKSNGKKYKLPKFKLIPGTPFSVDAFSYGPIDRVTGYFLTHFHSDHYKGLSNKFFIGQDGIKLYCSQVTGNLVRKELRIREEFITTLSIGQIYIIEGIHVGVFDANHCPGSVMFVFGVPDGEKVIKWHLHCGDFRASSSITNQKLKYNDYSESLNYLNFSDFLFESVYLDTTYAHPKHSFPPQEQVISACIHGCNRLLSGIYDPSGQKRLVPLKWLIAVGSYLIGKERIILAIAEAFDLKIYADDRKKSILRLLQWPELEDRLTDDPLATPLHFVSMGLLSKHKLSDYRDSFQGRFSHILGIRPTGWTFEDNKQNTKEWNLEMPKIDGNTGFWPLPYSEHSSFKELEDFLKILSLKSLIPTVDNWGDIVLDSRRVCSGDPVELLHQWARRKKL